MIIKIGTKFLNPELVESIRQALPPDNRSSKIFMASGDVFEVSLSPERVAELVNDSLIRKVIIPDP